MKIKSVIKTVDIKSTSKAALDDLLELSELDIQNERILTHEGLKNESKNGEIMILMKK